uniref:Guanylate kinase-like domain-containing protein n=1 Tax=Rhizophora mucronata TaxID=61149 RepID=A0A2P2JI52_RHIMU
MSHSWSWVRALLAWRKRSLALGVLLPRFRDSRTLSFNKFPFEHSIIWHRPSFNRTGIFIAKDGIHRQLIPSSWLSRGFCSLLQNETSELDSGSSDDLITSDLEHSGCNSCDGISTKKVKVLQQKPLDFTKIDIDLLPTVILVGRPNVGKSALFNRLIRRREALVYNTPVDHVTRDIREGIAKLADLRFTVLDSAGLETEAASGSILHRTASMTANVLSRTQFAIFLIDARAGLHPLDLEVGKWLRKHASGIRPIVALNKSESLCDGTGSISDMANEACALGFGDPIAISAETGLGMTTLYEALRPLLVDYMLQVLKSKII